MSTRRFVCFALALVPVLAACGSRGCGKTNDVQAKTDIEAARAPVFQQNPPGVAFVATTEGERKRFARGERIPLILRFSSSLKEKYKVDIGTWDNSGRLESETFRFEPPVHDPLEHYFAGGRTGGGARPMPPVLGNEPVEVKLDLNEWARFEKPGTYYFFITSARVDDGMRSTTSNLVELDIADDAAWADKELARDRGVLAAHPADDGNAEANAARRSLRFLETKSAARAMVDDLCRPEAGQRFQTQLGLYASPFRSDVVAMLEEGLAAPDCAISASYLSTLVQLDPRDAGVSEAVHRSFLASLAKKKGAAVPISLQTALQVIDEEEGREKAPNPMRDELRGRIAGVFATLPEAALARMLDADWTKVRSPAMAPTLLELVKQARPRGGQLRSVSDLALERLLELDYDGARAFIVSELARTDGARVSFTGKTLSLLKDAELPQVEQAMISGALAEEHDGATLELRSEVIARYATKSVLAKVWSLYRASTYFRISLLSYLYRHDPKPVEAEIRKIDSVDTLGNLGKSFWNPFIEGLVVEHLHARDASGAVSVLRERGSASAAKPLVERWRELHASGSDPARLGQDIWNALLGARNWMVTPETMRELAELCDDGMCRGDLRSAALRWGEDGKQPELVMWSHTNGTMSGWLGQYGIESAADVERRIKQVPAGITIRLKSKPPDVDDAFLAKVRAWAAEKNVPISAEP